MIIMTKKIVKRLQQGHRYVEKEHIRISENTEMALAFYAEVFYNNTRCCARRIIMAHYLCENDKI